MGVPRDARSKTHYPMRPAAVERGRARASRAARAARLFALGRPRQPGDSEPAGTRVDRHGRAVRDDPRAARQARPEPAGEALLRGVEHQRRRARGATGVGPRRPERLDGVDALEDVTDVGDRAPVEAKERREAGADTTDGGRWERGVVLD